MKKIILLALVLTNFTAKAQESVLLRLNYNKGDNYLTNVELNQNMGGQGEMNMNMEMYSTVNNADDKAITLESKIESIVMTMNQGGMAMNYDSNKTDEELDPMGQMMKSQFDPILQATIYNTFDRYGNVLEVRMEPKPLPGMEQFTDNQNAINFPDEEVSVGSSWTSEVDKQGMKVLTKYTVSKIYDGVVLLDVSGTLSGLATGNINGNSIVNISSGIQAASTIEMTMSVQGMEMSFVTSSTMTKM